MVDWTWFTQRSQNVSLVNITHTELRFSITFERYGLTFSIWQFKQLAHLIFRSKQASKEIQSNASFCFDFEGCFLLFCRCCFVWGCFLCVLLLFFGAVVCFFQMTGLVEWSILPVLPQALPLLAPILLMHKTSENITLFYYCESNCVCIYFLFTCFIKLFVNVLIWYIRRLNFLFKD